MMTEPRFRWPCLMQPGIADAKSFISAPPTPSLWQKTNQKLKKKSEGRLLLFSRDMQQQPRSFLNKAEEICITCNCLLFLQLSFMTPSPTRSPWSCGPTRWWTSLPCTSGWTQMHVRTSILALSCSSRRICRRLRADLSGGHVPRQAHTLHSLQSWTGRPCLGYLGRIC